MRDAAGFDRADEHVRHSDDPLCEGDVVGRRTVRRAAAVPALEAVPHLDGGAAARAGLRHQVGTEDRCRGVALGVGPNLIRIAHDHGVILRPVADSICFCPPLICTESQIREMFKRFRAALAETQEWLKSQLVAA